MHAPKPTQTYPVSQGNMAQPGRSKMSALTLIFDE